MNQKILRSISTRLVTINETVAVAESVTAGLIINSLSIAQNATQFLQGGLVAYNLGQKTRQLSVDPILAEATNCVSEQVAIQMARDVALKFCSHWGIAITGYAVPVPALNIKSCFAFYAFVRNGEIVRSVRLDTRLRGQGRVQQYFVDKVLAALLEDVG